MLFISDRFVKMLNKYWNIEINGGKIIFQKSISSINDCLWILTKS